MVADSPDEMNIQGLVAFLDVGCQFLVILIVGFGLWGFCAG